MRESANPVIRFILWTLLALMLLAVTVAFVVDLVRTRSDANGAGDQAATPDDAVGPPAEQGLPILGTAPEILLTDHEGKSYGSAQLAGRVWIVDFFFTSCPGPCPTMTRNMRRVQDETTAHPDVLLLSISVDPDRDTQPVLAEYAARQGADPSRWRFARGEKDTIDRIAKDGFRLAAGEDHSLRFVLVDGANRIRGYYDGTEPAEILRLVADVETLADRQKSQ